MNIQDLFDDMVGILLPKLCKELDDIHNVLIDLEITDDLELDGSGHMQAATLHLGYEDLLGMDLFEIECVKSLTKDLDAFKLMVAHELVHVMQHLRGDKFDHSLPYAKQLHEIEAYNKEQELVKYYESKCRR